jgi:hypothetical protein
MDELYTLLSDLSELDSELAILTTQRDSLRARISELVESHGGKVNIAGVGRAEIRAPVVIESYDRGSLDELITSLRETGNGDTADEIARCIKRTSRTGGLVVVMERKAKA